MKISKRILSGFIVAGMVFSLSACGGQGAASSHSDTGGAQGGPIAEATAVEQVTMGANGFAFEFSSKLLEGTNEDENFVCSPYSVYLPLAALLNATDEANLPALQGALGATGLTAEEVNAAVKSLLYTLHKGQEREFESEFHQPMKVANAIFVSEDYTLKPSFAEVFADFYNGQATQVNFLNGEAVEKVNLWAAEATDGLVTDVVDSFDEDTVAAIVNAIYFADNWAWGFNPEDTHEATFTTPTGQVAANFMLRSGDAQPYYEDDELQAVNLRFKTGGGMLILLPKAGTAAELLKGMTAERFLEIQNGMAGATGTLLLPKFEIESSTMNLKTALEALGVPLFNAATCPLTGGLLAEEVEVYLSAAVQKATIIVDETGTTAAAVTVITAATTAMPQPTAPFEMNCNKPFVFILYDNTYIAGPQVLFTGVVNRP